MNGERKGSEDVEKRRKFLRDFLIRKVNEWSGSPLDATMCICISLLASLIDIVSISAI